MQRRVRKIGDVRAHARHRQPAPRIGAVLEIAALPPFRIGHHRLAADFVEGDVLRRMPRRRRDRQRREYALGIARRPLQHLHAAHRPAGHGEQRVDAEMVEQHRLRPHHVADGGNGKFQPPGLAGLRIGGGGTGRAHAGADHVRTDHEEPFGVDWPPGADHSLPPARFLRYRIDVGDMLIAGQRVADQDGVVARRIERAVGLIGDLERREIDAGVQPQRLVGAETHHQRTRIIRLAGAVGRIKRRAGFHHHSHPAPANRLRNRSGRPPRDRADGVR